MISARQLRYRPDGQGHPSGAQGILDLIVAPAASQGGGRHWRQLVAGLGCDRRAAPKAVPESPAAGCTRSG